MTGGHKVKKVEVEGDSVRLTLANEAVVTVISSPAGGLLMTFANVEMVHPRLSVERVAGNQVRVEFEPLYH